MIRDLVTKKNINLQYETFVKKVFTETCYLERTFIAFKSKKQCFGHLSYIVCSNGPKFGTCVHHVMANNVAEGRFQLVSQKNHFSFSKCRKQGFL